MSEREVNLKAKGPGVRRNRVAVGAGQRFGAWEALQDQVGCKVYCRCECGTQRPLFATSLRTGQTKSCGCKNSKPPRVSTHGETDTKLYSVWRSMKHRCASPQKKNYGARGIRVCEEWQKYEPFAKWARENGYAEGLDIDREDNDGGYGPDNCRWTTRTVNINNRRNNRRETFFGETKTLAEWVADPRCAVGYMTLRWRLNTGWTDDSVITTPPLIDRRAY